MEAVPEMLRGKIKRSTIVRRDFKKRTGYSDARPAYQIDHIDPPKRSGPRIRSSGRIVEGVGEGLPFISCGLPQVRTQACPFMGHRGSPFPSSFRPPVAGWLGMGEGEIGTAQALEHDAIQSEVPRLRDRQALSLWVLGNWGFFRTHRVTSSLSIAKPPDKCVEPRFLPLPLPLILPPPFLPPFAGDTGPLCRWPP